MKTKHREPNLMLRSLVILCCLQVAWGCSPRKPALPIDNQPSVEKEAPPAASAPSHPDSSDRSKDASSQPPAQAAVDSAESPSSAMEQPAAAEPPQTWSVKRIIALSATGPIVIDVLANIGGKSLDEAAESATGRTIARISKDLEKPWTWEKLLDHPLIRSGWLGNLVAEGEQSEQLIRMYNTDGDDEADDEELPAFLTRGLASSPAFQFSDIGSAPGATAGRSPWDQLDANQDSSLDKSEIANIPGVVARFDLNADHVVTAAEMQANRPVPPQAEGMSNITQTLRSAIDWDAKNEPRKFASKLLEKYNAFGTQLPRDQWPGWTDKQWNYFDKNKDAQIGSEELEPITTVLPELELKIQFPANAEAGCALSAKVDPGSDFTWVSRLKTAGQATGKSGALAVTVTDSYTATNRTSLRAQLASALTNPQVAMLFRNQLMLSENAFALIDPDDDDKLSDEEFENAWEWLTAIRGNRILARWMFAESAWFRMADTDADGRVIEIELQKFCSYLAGLDRDNDGVVAPFEVPHAVLQKPLAIRLEIARTDGRLAITAPPSSETATMEVGWFAASDSNNDGFISNSEFLGSGEDFLGYDTDNDGFISPTEAYKSPIYRVQ